MKVGDLVRQKVRPQGIWLVTRIDTTGNWFDPVCQSFMVDQTNGIFVSSIEVYFKKT